MTVLTKAAIRCSSCGKFKRHVEFKAATDDDPTKPVCASCRAQTEYVADTGDEPLNGRGTKSLEKLAKQWRDIDQRITRLRADIGEPIVKSLDIPVIAYTPGGHEEQTTVRKALGLDPQLSKARTDAIWTGVGALAKAWTAELDRKETRHRARKRLTSLVKAEQSRRRVAVMKAKTAKVNRRTEAMDRTRMASERRLAKATAEQDALAKATAELSRQIAVVAGNAERAYGAIYQRQEMNRRMTAAREERDRNEFIFKASTTSDPVLRAAWLARAAGEDIDGDD